MRFGSQEGSGPRFSNETRWNGEDSEGRIYTGDYQGGRVQGFDANGNFIDMWHGNREFPLTAFAVDRDGIVYLAQTHEIQRYDGLTGDPPDHRRPRTALHQVRRYHGFRRERPVSGHHQQVSVAFSMAFNDQNQLVVMVRNDSQVIVYELNHLMCSRPSHGLISL